jgi:basic membrane lipoprotein Med (substrate-binding protein (PBP1-ABC) superfamily)
MHPSRKALAVLAVLCVLPTNCTNPNQTTAPANPTFKVALLSPGPVSDAGWNALAYEGLLEIRDQLDAEVSQVETKTPAQFEEGFRDYARRGFDLVFGHGFEFQEAAAAVAPDFPKTVFITTSGNTVRDNVAPLRFMLEEATYLAGTMAAMMSKSGVAGAIGGMAIPSVESTLLAFEAGAEAARPDFKVLKSYIGNWEDVGAAKEAAMAQIQQGADFLIHNSDAAGLGVFQAAQAASGVLVFGTNKNQNDVAPNVVLASAVIDIPGAFLRVARQVKNGTFHAAITELGMAENVVSFVVNPALADRIPEEVRKRVDETRSAILEHRLAVPSSEF